MRNTQDGQLPKPKSMDTDQRPNKTWVRDTGTVNIPRLSGDTSETDENRHR